MILFVGEKYSGTFANDYCDSNCIEIAFLTSSLNLDESTINEILSYENVTHIIYDLYSFDEEANSLADKIKKISESNNSKPIFYVGTNFLPDSSFILELKNKGFRHFIFSYLLSDQKEELKNCIEDKEFELVEEAEQDYEDETIIKETGSSRIIAIAGSQRRIGTTSVAIQLVKYLNLKGYKACYVEMNNTGYVKDILTWCECNHDKKLGKIRFENIDMFYAKENINKILEQSYDYFIYDFGNYNSNEFNKVSFLEKDTRILILGGKINELEYSFQAIKSLMTENVSYIFNLVDEPNRKELLSQMGSKKNKTYFTNIIKNPYVLNSVNEYDYLFDS